MGSPDTGVKVDVAINVFGKPCQTALCVLSLLRHSSQRIGTLFLTIEAAGAKYDSVDSSYLARISDKITILAPRHWIGLDALVPERLHDEGYRRSLRYQHAWENTDSDFLLLAHNDVYFKKDMLADMLAGIGDAIAIGEIGQCWNCPACRKHIVESLNINGGRPCSPERYREFKCSFEELHRM